MATTEKVQAQFLQVGDVLPATGDTVVGRPQAGLRTPKGKVEIGLTKGGHNRLAVWGKYTLISVTR